MKTQWVDLVPKRILILHADRMISNLLSYGLVNQGYIVEVGLTTTSDYRMPACDLIIMDSVLRNDKEFPIESVWRRMGNPPIIEIINAPVSFSSKEPFASYIVDHIQTPIEFPELMLKVTSLISRNDIGIQQLQVSPYTKAFRIRNIEIYPERFEIGVKSTMISLGRVELFLFIQLVQHIGTYVSAGQLQEMFTNDTRIVWRTIQNHMLKLREKLAIFQGELEIQIARKKGYRLMVYRKEGS